MKANLNYRARQSLQNKKKRMKKGMIIVRRGEKRDLLYS